MGDNSREPRSYDDSRPRNPPRGPPRGYLYSSGPERNYSPAWPSRQHPGPPQGHWGPESPQYPGSSPGYYPDSRDPYVPSPTSRAWPQERPYYDEPIPGPSIRPRGGPPPPEYARKLGSEPPFRSPDGRNRPASWDVRGQPRSPPRRSWSDSRRPEVPPFDGPHYDYPGPRPYDPGPGGDGPPGYSPHPGPSRMGPMPDRYHDRPMYYDSAPESSGYRPPPRGGDPWRDSERFSDGGSASPGIHAGMSDSGHSGPRRSDYSRGPEPPYGRYPNSNGPLDRPIPARRSPGPRASHSRSSSFEATDEFGRAIPHANSHASRSRPPSPRSAYSYPPSRTDSVDEYARLLPLSRGRHRSKSPGYRPSDYPPSPPRRANDESEEYHPSRRPHPPPQPWNAPSLHIDTNTRFTTPESSNQTPIAQPLPRGVSPPRPWSPSVGVAPLPPNPPIPTQYRPPPLSQNQYQPQSQPPTPQTRNDSGQLTGKEPNQNLSQLRTSPILPPNDQDTLIVKSIIPPKPPSPISTNRRPEPRSEKPGAEASWRVTLPPAPITAKPAAKSLTDAAPSVSPLAQQIILTPSSSGLAPNVPLSTASSPRNTIALPKTPTASAVIASVQPTTTLTKSPDVHFGQFQTDRSVRMEDVMPSLARQQSNGSTSSPVIAKATPPSTNAIVPSNKQIDSGPMEDVIPSNPTSVPSTPHTAPDVIASVRSTTKTLPSEPEIVHIVLSQNQELAKQANAGSRTPQPKYIKALLDEPIVPKWHPEEFKLSLMYHYGRGRPDSELIDEILAENLALNGARQLSPHSIVLEDVDMLSINATKTEGSEDHVMESADVTRATSNVPPEPTPVPSSTSDTTSSIDTKIAPPNQDEELVIEEAIHARSYEDVMRSVRQVSRDDDEQQLINAVIWENWQSIDIPSSRGWQRSHSYERSADIVVSLFETPERLEIERKTYERLAPVLIDRFDDERDALAAKNTALMEEYKSYHESWTLHRERLERLEAVRARKQGLLNPEDASTRSGRRGAISLADTARSDLELDQIMASLANEDLTNPDILSRKNLAAIPEMLSVVQPNRRRIQYDDQNGLIVRPEAYTHELHDPGHWTEAEKQAFIQAYLITPKQFGKIATRIPQKTAEQCVLYYYLHKKEINFKGLMSKQGTRKSRRGGGTGKRGRPKGSSLLANLGVHVDGGPDEEESPIDSSPAPDHASDGGEGEASTSRKRPRNARLSALKPLAESEDDFVESDGDDGEGTSKKKQKGSNGEGRGRGRPRGNPTTIWTAHEKQEFKRLLEIHGKNWPAISESLPGKTPMQVRNYFQNHSADQELRQIAARAEKPPRGSQSVAKLMKPVISNAPGVSSPLSKVVSLSEPSTGEPSSWGGIPPPPVPAYVQTQMQSQPQARDQVLLQPQLQVPVQPEPQRTNLPGIREFFRNVQDALTPDPWRSSHSVPVPRSEAP